jgi:flagellar motor switch protein FliN/FliY
MSDQTPLAAEALGQAFATEMATAVAALAGETTSVTPGSSSGETAWLARVAVTGAAVGDIHVGLTEEDARRVSALIMGFDPAEVADDAITDTLREICSQAAGALAVGPETSAYKLEVRTVDRAMFPGTPAAFYAFPLRDGFTPTLAIGSLLIASVAKPAPAPGTPAAEAEQAVAVAVTPVARALAQANAHSGNLDLLLDIELPLAVRFGQTELPLQTLTRLGPGSVIDLHRSADEPVEVLVSGKVIARGEVVVVEGNYGVRVTEVMSTVDRIRSLGA